MACMPYTSRPFPTKEAEIKVCFSCHTNGLCPFNEKSWTSESHITFHAGTITGLTEVIDRKYIALLEMKTWT